MICLTDVDILIVLFYQGTVVLEPENPDTAKPDFQPIPENGTCGYTAGAGYIVGGEETVRGEIPFLAALGNYFIWMVLYGCRYDADDPQIKRQGFSINCCRIQKE